MDQRVDVPVLIVGSGPTGLTLACDLARRGVAFRIVEKASEHFAGSRGKGLQPRTQEVFDDLGVIERVQATGGLYPPMRAYQGGQAVWDGRMYEVQEATPSVPYPNAWMLPQWRTGELLRQRLAELGGGAVELGTELTGFAQDDNGVTATLVRAGQIERVRTRYLVGADGGRSFVRRALDVGFEGETFETQRMLIADVQADGLDREHWHVWPGSGGSTLPVGLCPLAGTDTFQLTVPVQAEDAPDASLGALQKILDVASGGTDIRLHDVSWTTVYRANIRMVDRFGVGRVFLAGDAAHVHSPAGGQGLNTGIQDAYNLGWKLSQVLAGAPADLLDSYETERLPVAADVLGISTKLHNKGLRGDPSAHRRDDPELNQLGLSYRSGPLTREDRQAPGRVQAGDRAPDAPCHDSAGNPMRLFDAFRGPHFTLLAFGTLPAFGTLAFGAAVTEAHRYGDSVRTYRVVHPGQPAGTDTIVDTDGHAHRGYDIDGEALLLVRPDGYIGLATSDSAAVRDYLDQLVANPALTRH